MKKFLTILLSAAVLSVGAITASADHHKEAEMKKKGPNPAPKSVIHVVTVSWKADATDTQIKAALDGVHTLAASYKGITRAWTKTLKAQGDRKAAFVMEFRNAKALKEYAGSQEQKDWYESYYAAREGSTTFDISN